MSEFANTQNTVQRAVNLTYLRSRAREPLPTRPGSWENFAKEVDDACDELQEYRELLSAIHAYCTETMDDKQWDINVGRGQWDKGRVETMRVPCRNILEMIEGTS